MDLKTLISELQMLSNTHGPDTAVVSARYADGTEREPDPDVEWSCNNTVPTIYL